MNTRVPDTRCGMRKAPRQQRSRAMVSLIIEAATRVLVKTGWAKFTTNEVARIAGISVGSLYQYFPNKLALVEAIRQQHLTDILVVFDKARLLMGSADASTLARHVDSLIDGIVEAHLVNPDLHRVLLDEVPLAGRDAYEDFECRYRDFYHDFVARMIGAESPRVGVVAKVLASALEGVVHDASRRGELGAPDVRRELHTLVCCYLSGQAGE